MDGGSTAFLRARLWVSLFTNETALTIYFQEPACRAKQFNLKALNKTEAGDTNSQGALGLMMRGSAGKPETSEVGEPTLIVHRLHVVRLGVRQLQATRQLCEVEIVIPILLMSV